MLRKECCRLKKIVLILTLLLCLTVPVFAAGSAQIDLGATLATDGSAHVELRITLSAPQPGLTYPLPSGAEAVLVNGAPAQTALRDGLLRVSLPEGATQFSLSYNLPEVYVNRQEDFFLELPLLSGFPCSLDAFSFCITLPGDIGFEPQFESAYHQSGVQDKLSYTVAGPSLSGDLVGNFKDHEILKVTLQADPALFPHRADGGPLFDVWEIAVMAATAAAIAYYLLFLLPVIPRKVRCCTPPEGISAGEVGTCLTGCGADLSLMVITWAQLGYIQIALDGRKVLLRKQMDMGNERSTFEVQTFYSLFKGRSTVSGSSYHYAALCRKTAGRSPTLNQLFKRRSGSPRIFRILAIVAGALSGIRLGLAAGEHTQVQTVLAISFCVLCGAFSYFIQSGGKCLPLRDKSPFYIAFTCTGLWLALSFLVEELALALPMVLFQFISGLAAAYSGRRSERGKRCFAELMSLRHYMTTAPALELQRMLQTNPNYFYELAPYALAMGVDRHFAKRFGKAELPDCSFLDVGSSREMTAQEVAGHLRRAADILQAAQKRLPYTLKPQ